MTWILGIFFTLPIMASDLPQQKLILEDAYNLHQALNYMNVYTTGKCDDALILARKHLKKIHEKQPDKPFGKIIAALKKFKKPTKKDVIDLELLRLKYGDTLEAKRIEHKMTWHQEVQSSCPNAPHVE